MLNSIKDMVRVQFSKSEYVKLFAEICNDNAWGPTVPEMDRLVEAYPQGYCDLLPEIQLKFDSRKSNWTRCYKSLLILDHFCRTLEARYLDDLRSFMPTLKEMSTNFFLTDDKGVDRGIAIRERAKKVISLLSDADLLAMEREKSDKARAATGGPAGSGGSRYSGFGSSGSGGATSSSSSASTSASASASGGNRYTGHGSGGVNPSEHGHHHVGRGGSDAVVDQSPAAMEKNATNPQIDNDIEFARKLQEEEDRRARSGHQETSEEVWSDFELAKQIAGDVPQKFNTTTTSSSSSNTNHNNNASRSTVAGTVRTSTSANKPATIGTANASGIDLFSNFQAPPTSSSSATSSSNNNKTSLDDIFGGSPAPAQKQTTSTSQQQQQSIWGGGGSSQQQQQKPVTTTTSDDIFGAPVGAPSSSQSPPPSNNYNNVDPFGGFVGASSGPSTTSTSQHQTSNNNTTSTPSSAMGAPSGSGDAFACLAGLGPSTSKPASAVQSPATGGNNNNMGDIFGSPAPKPATQQNNNNNNPFPF